MPDKVWNGVYSFLSCFKKLLINTFFIPAIWSRDKEKSNTKNPYFSQIMRKVIIVCQLLSCSTAATLNACAKVWMCLKVTYAWFPWLDLICVNNWSKLENGSTSTSVINLSLRLILSPMGGGGRGARSPPLKRK